MIMIELAFPNLKCPMKAYKKTQTKKYVWIQRACAYQLENEGTPLMA